MQKIYLSEFVEELLDNADLDRLKDNVAIKVHFGEKGCTTFVSPEIVKAVYDKVISLKKKAALVETNVLYKGERTKASTHIKLAKEHGFDFAPIDILDSEMGDEYCEVELKEGLANPAKIAKGLKKYDSMIVISHFKGHIAAGYGGALKNIGMGIGSRAGKLHMHSGVSPDINKEECTGCKTCIKHCDFNAITLVDNKAQIDDDKCSGCAMCISVCPTGAVKIPWGTSTNEELQKKIVDYADATLHIIPKNNVIYINVLEDITPGCDCMGEAQEPMMKDIGILMGYDPVAIDQASFDIVQEISKGDFDKINSIDKSVQTNYAEKKGLGLKDYDLYKF